MRSHVFRIALAALLTSSSLAAASDTSPNPALAIRQVESLHPPAPAPSKRSPDDPFVSDPTLEERAPVGEEECADDTPATVFVTVTVDGPGGGGAASETACTTCGAGQATDSGAGSQQPQPTGDAGAGAGAGAGSSSYDDGSCKTGCGGASESGAAGGAVGTGSATVPAATPAPTKSDSGEWDDWGDDGSFGGSSSSGSAAASASGTAVPGGAAGDIDDGFSAGFRSATGVPILASFGICLVTTLLAGVLTVV